MVNTRFRTKLQKYGIFNEVINFSIISGLYNLLVKISTTDLEDNHDSGGAGWNTDWIDIIFDKYPDWDDEGIAPKEIYILYHILLEILVKKNNHDIKEYRDFCIKKAIKFTIRDKPLFLKKDIKNPIDFYQQFTQYEFSCIGV